MFKQALACTAIVTMLMVNPVIAQQSAPTSKKAQKIEILVRAASGLIESKGKAAFIEFRKKGSQWFTGDTYLFVYDLNSNVLFNAAFPGLEGTNTTGQKDAKGKLFNQDFIRAVHSQGAGWVDYMLSKPGQSQPSQKWVYVTGVSVDGVAGFVASGFYPK